MGSDTDRVFGDYYIFSYTEIGWCIGVGGLHFCVTSIAGRHIGIALAIVVVVGVSGGGVVVVRFLD